MLDDIYYRLFLEVIPQDPKLRGIDIHKLTKIRKHHEPNIKYGHLIDTVYQTNPDSKFGLLYGRYLRPSILCDFSRMLHTAQNFGECLKIIQSLNHILNPRYYPVITRSKGVVSVSITFPFDKQVSEYLRRFCAESLFSYTLNGFREISNNDFQPMAISLDYPPPTYAKEYESLLGCEVRFNQPLNVLKFSERLLDIPLVTRNATLHEIYLKKCLDAWQGMERDRNFEYRAICNIMRHHPDAFNSQNLADKLNISVRGLQKRLNKHGGSYSHLAHLARRELAKVYLYEDDHNLDHTAEKLGFQSSSGFRKFFKSEFSQTPAEYMDSFARENA